MNNFIKFLIKYWHILSIAATLIVSVAGSVIHLKGRIDSNLETIANLKAQLSKMQTELNEHDQDIDDLDHRVIPLEVKEELREKGLLK